MPAPALYTLVEQLDDVVTYTINVELAELANHIATCVELDIKILSVQRQPMRFINAAELIKAGPIR
jgi:hypothetical protein